MSINSNHQNILLLYKSGNSIRQIAIALGVTKYTVEKALKENSQTVSDQLSESKQTVSELLSGKDQTNIISLSDQEQTVSDATLRTDLLVKRESKGYDLGHQNYKSINAVSQHNLLMYLYKDNLQVRYSESISKMSEFLNSDLRNAELAKHFIDSRQERIHVLIKYARDICYKCSVVYHELFLAYTLDTLYLYLEQQLEFIETESELKIKEDATIKLLLKVARNSDVFAEKRDYAIYFPKIAVHSY